MLFILVMDVLSTMISKVEQDRMLESLAGFGIKHRLSLYAGDVILFLRPLERDFTGDQRGVRYFWRSFRAAC